jgi:hypothetical protein
MSNKRLLSDQVQFRLEGSFPDASASVQRQDIYKAIEQKINAKLKMEHFTVTLQQGETIPDNLFLAFYENIAVTSYGGKSKSTLPVMPASLPRNMGIFEITPVIPTGNNQTDLDGSPFIPLQAGQEFLLKSDKLLNSLMGQVGYTPQGKTIVYTKNLPLLGVSSVNMQLAVFDISQYGETDTLPIPSSMEERIINELVQQFGNVTPEIGAVNPYTSANQKANP